MWHKVMAVASALMLIGAGVASATPDRAFSFGPYQLRNLKSGKCLEIPDSRTANGVHAQQWDCVAGVNTQLWWYDVIQSGEVQVIQLRNVNSGKCLEVADSRLDDGAPVQQWDCVGVATQMWESAATCWECPDPAYTLANYNSGKLLEVENSRTYNGARVQQWKAADDAPGQFWYYR